MLRKACGAVEGFLTGYGLMAKKPAAKHKPKPPAGRNPAAKSAPARRPAPATTAKPARSSAPKPAAVRVAKKPSKPHAAVSPEVEIQRLDQELLATLNRRAELTTQVLHQRIGQGGGLFDPAADEQLFADLSTANSGPLPAATVRGVWREILSAARRNVKVQRVAYLGPPYSFTHLAGIERFGQSADLVPVSTIAAVFEEVNRGHAEFGLVPIENSTDGRVVDTLHMFTRLPLRICGEVQIAVHHNLLGRSPRGEVTEIYSKPQALSQCRDWLARNMPHARTFEVTSTSTAAQLARDKPGVAAVASMQAAVAYDLQVLAERIEDNPQNVTRFAVIGDAEPSPTGNDRTSILLQIPHRPGSLSDALQAFKKNKVNLTWIESFPLGNGESGYLFFLDFEGHVSEPRSKRTLADIETLAVSLKVLGSYPVSAAVG